MLFVGYTNNLNKHTFILLLSLAYLIKILYDMELKASLLLLYILYTQSFSISIVPCMPLFSGVTRTSGACPWAKI